MTEPFEHTKPKVTAKPTVKMVENLAVVSVAIAKVKTKQLSPKLPKDRGFWENRSKRSVY